ncbi:MAG: DUF364 domain-containing protein [Bacteroidota bacterium]
MISDKTYNLIKSRHSHLLEQLTIADVRLGMHLSAVQLSDGSFGVAGTLNETRQHFAKKDRDFGDFTTSQITGRRIIDLFESTKKSNIIDTLKIAALNAISSRLISDTGYRILEDTDPVDLIDLQSEKVITIVGGFQSYIQMISATRNKLYVLELDENALTEEHKKFYVPAKEYTRVLPVSDIVIITGLTLVNNTIGGLLSSVKPGALVIVTGPSASILPDILFENNVNIIGATRITNPSLLFKIVSEAGTGYHLIKFCAQKICILNEK